MNACPYANESATCELLLLAGDAPTIVYCERCAQIAVRCPSGHWNRVLARYCTHCSQALEKPAVWRMASGNPQRTATLQQMPSVDELRIVHGFGPWVTSTPEIETSGNLPGLLAIDGLIVVPNPGNRSLDAYTIGKPLKQRSPNLKWRIAFNEELTYASTPIYHGLHLFYVLSGRIQKSPVFGGETVSVEINSVDAGHIEPIPACAPLKCDVDGKPVMVVGLKQGLLLFDFTSQDGIYIEDTFFSKNTVMAPVQCGEYLVFTALQGEIFSLNTDVRPNKGQTETFDNISFSAPVSLGKKVYFEALNDNGERSLACFDPGSGEFSKVRGLDSLPTLDLEERRSLFIHPPLTDGEQLFLSDRYGQVVYTYDNNSGISQERKLPQNDSKHRFVPHQSIVVQNRIYSAHSYELTVIDLPPNFNVQYRSLAMGFPTNPSPIARPIRYGDKLFILCKDRFVCLDY